MYKRIKITKRIRVTFGTLRKKTKPHNGFNKSYDDINGISFYSLTIHLFIITLIIERNVGCCQG